MVRLLDIRLNNDHSITIISKIIIIKIQFEDDNMINKKGYYVVLLLTFEA